MPKRHFNEFLNEDCKKIFNEYWEAGNKGMQEKFIRSQLMLQKRKFQRIFQM